MNLTMEGVGIHIGHECAMAWYNYLWDKKERFNPVKTQDELWAKFLDGFPAPIQGTCILNERSNPNRFIYPAAYPAGTPDAGNAHALAGLKDVETLAKNLQTSIDHLIHAGTLSVRKPTKANDALIIFPENLDDPTPLTFPSTSTSESDEIYFVNNKGERMEPTDKTR